MLAANRSERRERVDGASAAGDDLPFLLRPVTDDLSVTGAEVEVRGWGGGVDHVEHDGVGTAFVVVLDGCRARLPHGEHPLPPASYAVLTEPARVDHGAGLLVTHRSHDGLPMIGGPVEWTGRLRYIDGCSDTVLVSPVVRGDPSLNLLHLPSGVTQSDHQHPSVRVGMVVAGSGRCVIDRADTHELVPGMVFVLPPRRTHRFETVDAELLVIAWHPDSDVGPTDDDHPMLNATLRPDTAARFR